MSLTTAAVLGINVSLRNYLDNTIKEGTPVNAVAAQGTLTLTGVAIDAETITIDSDVYEFAADAAQSVTGDNTPIDITSYTTASQGTWLLS